MQKIALIIPYFGEFPAYFQLFLNSCRLNDTINWILITDIEAQYEYPDNVNVVYMKFEKLKELIQNRFDFQISLDVPYKLCDYKPAYGYIFKSYISEYDFWGYCDLDVLFGDLRAFFSEDDLKKYDKIGHLGHLSIYRNDPKVNSAFMCAVDGVYKYKEVFSSNSSYIFDEWESVSINRMFLRQGLRIWIWNEFFDVYPYRDNLQRVIWNVDSIEPYNTCKMIDTSESYVTWENGCVFAWKYVKGKWEKKELAYVHFQKRDMTLKCNSNENKILGLSNSFIPFRNYISVKYRCYNWIHKVFDCKRIVYWYKCMRYNFAVSTAPFRHIFRKDKKCS